ncbi:hypothetical protein PsorP6_000819 [Peronosclerospora sorghi]|uniref:Uncharacterized protein n=1 Tax=Peronosclerospora sorghi TaxID=230839 RepID=A0ACC0WXK4_9STRA|nr:hypothetical protein PsorP6_000819 [Peronosclerospora sorghi]
MLNDYPISITAPSNAQQEPHHPQPTVSPPMYYHPLQMLNVTETSLMSDNQQVCLILEEQQHHRGSIRTNKQYEFPTSKPEQVLTELFNARTEVEIKKSPSKDLGYHSTTVRALYKKSIYASHPKKTKLSARNECPILDTYLPIFFKQMK